eukprot:scaffold50558_cov30-Tisochrysis_lutea.AAC.9
MVMGGVPGSFSAVVPVHRAAALGVIPQRVGAFRARAERFRKVCQSGRAVLPRVDQCYPRLNTGLPHMRFQRIGLGDAPCAVGGVTAALSTGAEEASSAVI